MSRLGKHDGPVTTERGAAFHAFFAIGLLRACFPHSTACAVTINIFTMWITDKKQQRPEGRAASRTFGSLGNGPRYMSGVKEIMLS